MELDVLAACGAECVRTPAVSIDRIWKNITLSRFGTTTPNMVSEPHESLTELALVD